MLDSIIPLLSFIFLIISLIFLASIYFSKQKLKKENLQLKDKILSLESRVLEFQNKKNNMKLVKEPHHNKNASRDLVNYRKEIGKLKSELKKEKHNSESQKEESESQLSSIMEKLNYIKKENEELIEELKKTRNQNTDKTLSKEPNTKKEDVGLSSDEIKALRYKLLESERIINSRDSNINTLKEKVKKLDNDLKDWREIRDVSKTEKITPKTILKWYRRALEAKKMYKIIQKTRELSDEKLLSYQDSIISLAKWFLEKNNFKLPIIRPSENKADRYLSEMLTQMKVDVEKESTKNERTDNLTLSNEKKTQRVNKDREKISNSNEARIKDSSIQARV